MIKTAATLAPNEQFRLEQCEKIIERGLNTFVEVGRALTEIRDSKLYRISYKTFEAYCKERWEIGRSRAYELIDHAKVAEIAEAVGGDLSAVADISKRDVRYIKSDLPAVTEDVKARIEQGEPPSKAIAEAVAAKRAEREKVRDERNAKQAEFDQQREAVRASLPEAIKRHEDAKQAVIESRRSSAPTPDDDVQFLHDRIEELEEANRALEEENCALKAEVKKFSEMKAEFERGGFDEVIRGRDEVIRVQSTRIETESRDKVSWMNSAKWWRQQAISLGYSNDTEIDIETGEVING